MATRNITVTYPDGSGATILAALKWNYGQISDGAGGMRDMTNAEALARFDTSVKASLKDMVNRYQVELAKETAAAAVVPVDVT